MSIPERPVVVYFDGACEPANPGGHMGWAWVALSRDGQEIEHSAAHIPAAPENTNNVAEYLGLIDVLIWLRAYNFAEVRVRGDSQLVIRQMTGEYRVNSPNLRPLYEEAAQHAAAIRPTFEWVKRDLNYRADRYSKAVLPPEALYARRYR